MTNHTVCVLVCVLVCVCLEKKKKKLAAALLFLWIPPVCCKSLSYLSDVKAWTSCLPTMWGCMTVCSAFPLFVCALIYAFPHPVTHVLHSNLLWLREKNVFSAANTFSQSGYTWPLKLHPVIEIDMWSTKLCFLWKQGSGSLSSVQPNTENAVLVQFCSWVCVCNPISSNLSAVKCFHMDYLRSSHWSSPCCWRPRLWGITSTFSRYLMSKGIHRYRMIFFQSSFC